MTAGDALMLAGVVEVLYVIIAVLGVALVWLVIDMIRGPRR